MSVDSAPVKLAQTLAEEKHGRNCNNGKHLQLHLRWGSQSASLASVSDSVSWIRSVVRVAGGSYTSPLKPPRGGLLWSTLLRLKLSSPSANPKVRHVAMPPFALPEVNHTS